MYCIQFNNTLTNLLTCAFANPWLLHLPSVTRPALLPVFPNLAGPGASG